MGRLNVITWARWKSLDAVDQKHYIIVTVSVLHPSFEYPLVCLVLSMVSAKGRILQRFTSLEALQAFITIPLDYIDRIRDGISKAASELTTIHAKLKTLMALADLPPGAHVVRTDTGEIIAQAERILRGQED